MGAYCGLDAVRMHGESSSRRLKKIFRSWRMSVAGSTVNARTELFARPLPFEYEARGLQGTEGQKAIGCVDRTTARSQLLTRMVRLGRR